MGLKEPRTPQLGTRNGTKRDQMLGNGTQTRRGPWQRRTRRIWTEQLKAMMAPAMSLSMQQKKTRCPRPDGMSHTSAEASRDREYLRLNLTHSTPPHGSWGEMKKSKEERNLSSNLKQLSPLSISIIYHWQRLEPESKVEFHYREIRLRFCTLGLHSLTP